MTDYKIDMPVPQFTLDDAVGLVDLMEESLALRYQALQDEGEAER